MKKILTWNTQGYKVKVASILNGGLYDIVCIQEAGTPLKSFRKIDSVCNGSIEVFEAPQSTTGRANNHIGEYLALYYMVDSANNRCSLVTYVKAKLLKDAFLFNSFEKARPALCVNIENNFIVCNVHLISGNPNSAKGQFGRFKGLMNGITLPYCVVGDFNIKANDMDSVCEYIGGSIVRSNKPTHSSDSELDYMYLFNKNCSIECEMIKEDESDHNPVEFTLQNGRI